MVLVCYLNIALTMIDMRVTATLEDACASMSSYRALFQSEDTSFNFKSRIVSSKFLLFEVSGKPFFICCQIFMNICAVGTITTSLMLRSRLASFEIKKDQYEI